MTRWTIDGRGDTGTKAIHYQPKRYPERGSVKRIYNVQRLSAGFWLSEVEYPDGSILQLNASETTEAGAQVRCEFHAAS